MRTAIFVYETAQVPLLPKLFALVPTGEGYDVIACGADIEFLLEEKGIAYNSARELRRTPTSERLIAAKDLGENLLSTDSLPFFSHRNISLGRLFTPALQYYFAVLLYYIDIVASALEKSYDRVLAYAPVVQQGPAAGILARHSAQALPDALRLVCADRAIALELIQTTSKKSPQGAILFEIKRSLFALSVRALNQCVRLVVRRKKIRILASELWKNIAPLMHELPDGELILLDRMECFAIGIRSILRNRMQFFHSDDFLTILARRIARERSRAFLEHWEHSRNGYSALRDAAFRSYDLVPILTEVLEHLIRSSEKIVRDIEGTWAMMEYLKPDIVVVRASTSAQTHFALLCEVARLQNIPSLEIQHGFMCVGPETFMSPHTAEYIAEYGPLDRKMWREHAYASHSHLFDVGSPRFEEHSVLQQARLKGVVRDSFEIVVISPAMTPGFWTDSYDVLDYFGTTAKAIGQIPKARTVIKLRPTRADEMFLREAIRRTFRGASYTVAIFEPLADLLPKADCIVSCPSTAVLEALLSHRPLIINASLPIYESLVGVDLEPHRTAKALIVSHTEKELSKELAELAQNDDKRYELSESAERFMVHNYLFHDGKASKRLADTIHLLSVSTE